jgi:hypothetical protein
MRQSVGFQVAQHRKHPSVVCFGRWEAELLEDALHVFLDRTRRYDKVAAIAAIDRPSAIRPSTSRARK